MNDALLTPDLLSEIDAALRAQVDHPVHERIRARSVNGQLQVWLPQVQAFAPCTLEELTGMVSARSEAIQWEEMDPFNHGYEPQAWDEIDWEICRLRVRNPGVVIQPLICGANGGGKTFYCASRYVHALVQGRDYLGWSFSQDDRNSAAVPQKTVYHFLPQEYKTQKGSVKRTGTVKLNYTKASGFTDGRFGLHNGAVSEFRFYTAEISTLEGVRPHLAWMDEEFEVAWLEAVERRLLTHAGKTKVLIPKFKELLRQKEENPHLKFPRELLHELFLGVQLISFTPKNGYTPTFREFMRGGTWVREIDAELLPRKDEHGNPAGYERMPKLVHCAKPTRLVYFLHAWDNPHGGNWEGMKKMAADKTAQEIKWWAYGVAEATTGVVFTQFNRTAHVRPLAMVPREGTWYHRVDPCNGTRNFFMIWVKVSPLEEHVVVREWPQEDDFIPYGVGHPGPWALPSTGKRKDGDMGPAQHAWGFGFDKMVEEIRRVELELGRLERPDLGDRAPPITVLDGCRMMDGRAGNTQTMLHSSSATLIQVFASYGLYFLPAVKDSGTQEGSHIVKEGAKFVDDMLDYDKEGAVLNQATGLYDFHGKGPRLFIAENCTNLIFAMENWTGADKGDGATKDPIDTLIMHAKSWPKHLAREKRRWQGGGSY